MEPQIPKLNWYAVVVFTLVCLFTGTSNAALVSINNPALGNGALTRDTDTGLDWLDLSFTANMSYNAAVSTYGTLGFRHASPTEVFELFANAGIPNIDTGTSAANYAPSINLQELVGCLVGFNSTTGSSTCGSYGRTAIEDGRSELSWINRNDTALESTVIVNSNNFIGPSPEVFDTAAHTTRSHWMVRPVPIPPTLILFVSAISCLWPRKVAVT